MWIMVIPNNNIDFHFAINIGNGLLIIHLPFMLFIDATQLTPMKFSIRIIPKFMS